MRAEGARLNLVYYLALVLLAASIAFYWVARYSGNWVEWDTATMTPGIESVIEEGRLLPEQGRTYRNGFGYQVLSSAVVGVTDLDVQRLQQWVYPFWALILAATISYPLFRLVTGRPAVAALASVLLLLQSDFIFTAARGSHEKLSYALILLAWLLMLKSLDVTARPANRMGFIVLFYLAAFTLATSNVFFAASIAVALAAVALTAFLVLQRRKGSLATAENPFSRLYYSALIAPILLSVVVFYIYQPARHMIVYAKHIAERVSLLLLDLETESAPYATLDVGWMSRHAWVVLTALTWFILAVSFVQWARLTVSMFRGRSNSGLRPALLLFIFFYPIFGGLVALGLVTDYAGVVLGNNLQLRMFVLLVFIACPLAAMALFEWLGWERRRVPISKALLGASLAVLLVFSAGASMVKATTDPIVSNYWTFYSGEEKEGMRWVYNYVKPHRIWADFDLRLGGVLLMHYWGSDRERIPVVNAGGSLRSPLMSVATGPFEYVFISDIIKARALRLGQPLPGVKSYNRLYDSRQVQIYASPDALPATQSTLAD